MCGDAVEKNGTTSDLLRDTQGSAQLCGLCYVQDEMPGIQRVRYGRRFRYLDPDGKPIRDKEVLRRIDCLRIPPAWEGVWICALAHGHLQATGRDSRGRKQYLYHAQWIQLRNEVKFAHMLQFAGALPALRRQVDADLARRGLPRAKVEATIVRLLESSLIRIGNEEYLRENQSFGLTTLRRRHVVIASSNIRFAFRGKSGQWHERSIHDRRVATILRRMLDLPGQELFRCRDDDGELRTIASDDINAYLRAATGADFTAKDIRTWHATVTAACELRELGPFTAVREGKQKVTEAVRRVAALLGNRPAVCRKYYIHPEVLASYRSGILLPALEAISRELDARFPAELDPLENAVRLFLTWRQSVASAPPLQTAGCAPAAD